MARVPEEVVRYSADALTLEGVWRFFFGHAAAVADAVSRFVVAE